MYHSMVCIQLCIIVWYAYSYVSYSDYAMHLWKVRSFREFTFWCQPCKVQRRSRSPRQKQHYGIIQETSGTQSPCRKWTLIRGFRGVTCKSKVLSSACSKFVFSDSPNWHALRTVHAWYTLLTSAGLAYRPSTNPLMIAIFWRLSPWWR